VRRRELLKGAALAGWGLSPALAEAAAPAIVVFDSRHDLSRQWARRQPALRRVDTRNDILRQWRTLELGSSAAVVSGLTTWADFQVVCGCAAETRRKVRHQWVKSPDGAILPLVAWTLS
jgi:hypothetical protein